jgi:hypothetical protein
MGSDISLCWLKETLNIAVQHLLFILNYVPLYECFAELNLSPSEVFERMNDNSLVLHFPSKFSSLPSSKMLI